MAKRNPHKPRPYDAHGDGSAEPGMWRTDSGYFVHRIGRSVYEAHGPGRWRSGPFYAFREAAGIIRAHAEETSRNG